MTLKQFIKNLPKDGWELTKNFTTENVSIRKRVEIPIYDDGNWGITCCPLTVRSKEKINNWVKCGRDMGLPINISEAIITAADNDEEFILKNCNIYDTAVENIVELRRHLLKACGL